MQRGAAPCSTITPRLLVALFSIFAGQPLAADQVLLRNGDRLSGDVVRQGDAQLQLETTYAGLITIDWSQVREIRLEEPAQVLLDDDSVIEVVGIARDGNQLRLRQAGRSQSMTLSPERVKIVAPAPWETGDGSRFDGQINLAFQDETGNSSNEEFDADLTLSYRRRWDEFWSYGQLEYDTAGGVTTSDNWLLQNKYVRSFPKTRWYGAAWLNFQHDRFADIQLRYYLGPAIGYRFLEGNSSSLSAEIGPLYLNEDYYDNTDQDFWGPGLFLTYEQDLWDGALQFYHRNTAFGGLSSSKTLWESWTGFSAPLVGGFIASLEYQIDYDSRPTTETKTTDNTFRLKLGYRW